jgi:hypothetical protein
VTGSLVKYVSRLVLELALASAFKARTLLSDVISMTSGKIALVFARPLQLVPAHDVSQKRGKEKETQALGKKIFTSLHFASDSLRSVHQSSQPATHSNHDEREGRSKPSPIARLLNLKFST